MSAVPALLAARRSIRSFDERAVDPAVVDACIEAACLAPAPHHSRPWRFASLMTRAARTRLAEAMGARWRTDLLGDGIPEIRADQLVTRSRDRIAAAPAAVLACLTVDGLDSYPDDRRRGAEWGMGLLSLGAAVQNLMLAATETGLATCWIAAPIFCPDDARAGLELAPDWVPQALVLVGHPDPGYRPSARPPIALDGLRRSY